MDTALDIGNSVNGLLEEFNYKTKPISFYRDNVGGGIEDLLKKSLPSNHGRLISSYFESLNRHSKLNLNKEAKVYPYVFDILDFLKSRNINIAIISNKPQEQTDETVHDFFSDYVDITIGSGGKFPIKPNPESSNYVLDKFKVMPKDCFFVGDSGFDVMTAKNNGMLSLGVLWGMSNEKKLKSFNPDFLFKTQLELLKSLKNS